MREMILVEENVQFKGVLSEMPVSTTDSVVVPPSSTVSIPVNFKYKPINYGVDLALSWRLNGAMAKKGLVINGTEKADGSVTTIYVSNVSGKEVAIEAGQELASVEFHQKAILKAVDAEKSRGIVDLSMGGREL